MVKHRWRLKTTMCISDRLRNAMRYIFDPFSCHNYYLIYFSFSLKEFVNSYDCGSVYSNSSSKTSQVHAFSYLENGKTCNFSLTSGKVDSMLPFFLFFSFVIHLLIYPFFLKFQAYPLLTLTFEPIYRRFLLGEKRRI